MNPQRILLIANDPALCTFYGEALASSGFHVSVASSGADALLSLREAAISAVVMDLMLPGMSAAEFLQTLRADKATRPLPVIGLPTELEPLARAAVKSGLTKRLERFSNPVGAVVKALHAALDIRAGDLQASGEPPRLAGKVAILQNRVTTLRRSLQLATSSEVSTTRFSQLLQDLHDFSSLADLSGNKALFQMATALEALAFDLHQTPAGVTPSIWRTVGQGIDLLSHLLSRTRVPSAPCGNTQIFVVEDDALARQLISSAVGLVGLSSVSAATPAAGLSILSVTAFDLIFLDVGLPKMNGFDLCAKVRALPLHEKTPIVFLTGASTFQNRVQSSLSGGNDFIGKPFNIAELGVKALLWTMKGLPCEVSNPAFQHANSS